MKTKLILLALFLAAHALPAQDTLSAKVRYVRVKLIASSHTLGGYLESVSDSAVVLAVPIRGIKPDTASLLIVPVNRIASITIRKFRKSAGNGMAKGAFIGFFTGGMIGLASGDQSSAGDFMYISPAELGLAMGILGAVGGAIIGAAVGGSANEKIIIDGNIDLYNL